MNRIICFAFSLVLLVGCSEETEDSGGVIWGWNEDYIDDGVNWSGSNGGSGVSGGHEWVDLGLASGVLWATVNIGAASEEEFGDYYAWGETEEKSTFDIYNSKWYDVDLSILFESDVVDEKWSLTSNYDVASVRWGKGWRMPTMEEMRELSMLKSEWTKVNGVNGRRFIGKNGCSVFFPAAGYRYGDVPNIEGAYCNYYSSTGSADDAHTYGLYLSSEGVYWYKYYRDYGMTIRAVRSGK